jgi:hypothetical protein
VQRRVKVLLSLVAILPLMMVVSMGPAAAEPNANEIAPPLPVFVPTPSNFTPLYPFPFDQTRASVTAADINAQRELCQWYNAQYETLIAQIDRFNADLISDNGDYGAGDNQQIADAVTANIDQTEAFLAPRVQALTQSQDSAGDQYFPLYQGKSFYLLWQLLSNVSAGIHGQQPAWFVGPSFQRAMRWGTEIKRSHVCR